MEDGGFTAPVSRREKKKRKKLELAMEVLSETGERMAPIVGYFPSGYDPITTGSYPDVKLFRNAKKPSRLELVVSPADCNLEFVGKSYTGEAAMPQFSTYALGVLDKESQTLKIVPIAANKVLRLEPRLINGFGDPSEEGQGAVVNEKKEHQMSDLTYLYGTKRSKRRENKLKSIKQITDDPSVFGLLKDETHVIKDGKAKEDIKEPLNRNIPPHDLSAVMPEDAYPLHKIIPKGERDYLLDIFEVLKSEPKGSKRVQFWEENHYPSFVFNRAYKLREMKAYISDVERLLSTSEDEAEKIRFACILSYITHLINFQKTAKSSRFKHHHHYVEAMTKFRIPEIVFHRFLALFLDPVSGALTSEKNELLIGYVLVLTLFADDFRTDTTDIEKDLAMTVASITPHFLNLGCVPHNDGPFKKRLMTLPAPLILNEQKPKFRRNNRHRHW